MAGQNVLAFGMTDLFHAYVHVYSAYIFIYLFLYV